MRVSELKATNCDKEPVIELVKIVLAVTVLASSELVKIAEVERFRGMVAIPPPRAPSAVEKDEMAAFNDKVETYVADPNPVTVETRTGVERKPEVW